jgi:hypothetical protein
MAARTTFSTFNCFALRATRPGQLIHPSIPFRWRGAATRQALVCRWSAPPRADEEGVNELFRSGSLPLALDRLKPRKYRRAAPGSTQAQWDEEINMNHKVILVSLSAAVALAAAATAAAAAPVGHLSDAGEGARLLHAVHDDYDRDRWSSRRFRWDDDDHRGNFRWWWHRRHHRDRDHDRWSWDRDRGDRYRDR